MNAPLPASVLPVPERRLVPPAMLDALKARFGERCSTGSAVREQHGGGAINRCDARRHFAVWLFSECLQ